MAARDLPSWLAALKLERYLDVFQDNGYSMDNIGELTDARLESMGITLAGHKNRLLKNLPGGRSDGPSRRTRLFTGDDFGLNEVLGKLQSISYELEDAEIDTSAGAPPRPPPASLSAVGEKELDDILEVLCAFSSDQPTPGASPVKDSSPAAAGAASSDRHSGSLPPAPAPAYMPFNPAASAPLPTLQPLMPAEAGADDDDPLNSLRRVKSVRPPPRTAAEVQFRLQSFRNRLSVTGKGQISQGELEGLMKEEKIRIAMEKLAEASVTKDVIKIHIDEGGAGSKGLSTSQTLLVESIDSARTVCSKVIVKARLEEDPNWTLVEECPELGIERTLEDHESVGDAYRMWPPTSTYRFIMRRNTLKYDLFIHPERYLPTQIKEDIHDTASGSERTERAKRVLMQELFAQSHRVPDLKGYLYEKDGSKKWKKKYFLLRASGIYSSSKGESEASKDLQLFVKFDEIDVCQGGDFASRAKAPTELCIVFRPRKRKQVLDFDEMFALCAPEESDFAMWYAGVRLAKHRTALRDNYDDTMRKLDELVSMGAMNATAKKTLVSDSSRAVPMEQSNRVMIDVWKATRSLYHKGVSAATGVKFHEEAPAPAPEPAPAVSYDPRWQYGWYHGDIARDQAETLFAARGFETGWYLVRTSTSKPGDHVLSVSFGGKVHHFHIRTWPNPGGSPQYSLDDGPRYVTLDDLVDHYSEADERLPTRLSRPIIRTGAVDASEEPPSVLMRKKSQHTALPKK